MSAAALTLRLATRDDAAALALLSRDLIETGLGWTYRRRRIVRLIDDRDSVVLVAHDASEIAGFAAMSFGDQRAHLVLLAVRPSRRRRGIGRRLLQWLVESAQVAGIASIGLELRAANDGAAAFYRALGFSETALLDGYYRDSESARRMVRVLRPDMP